MKIRCYFSFWEIGVLAPASSSNCIFTPTFKTLWICPCVFKMKAPFAPGCSSVTCSQNKQLKINKKALQNRGKRLDCPLSFHPTRQHLPRVSLISFFPPSSLSSLSARRRDRAGQGGRAPESARPAAQVEAAVWPRRRRASRRRSGPGAGRGDGPASAPARASAWLGLVRGRGPVPA